MNKGRIYVHCPDDLTKLYESIESNQSFFNEFMGHDIILIIRSSMSDANKKDIKDKCDRLGLSVILHFKNLPDETIYGTLLYASTCEFLSNEIYDFYGFYDITSHEDYFHGALNETYNLRDNEVLICNPDKNPLMKIECSAHNNTLFFSTKHKSNFDCIGQIYYLVGDIIKLFNDKNIYENHNILNENRSLMLFLWCFRIGMDYRTFWNNDEQGTFLNSYEKK